MQGWLNILFVSLVALIEFPALIKGVGLELLMGPRHPRASAGAWCYDLPTCDQNSDMWKGGPCKDGVRQSPINIVSASATIDYEKDCPLDFGLTMVGAYKLEKYKITNAGKSINIEPANPGDFDKLYFRWPAKDDGNYTLHSMHFHWGPDDNSGSEHTVDGKAFAMEAHLVHYRSSSYKTLEEAVGSKEGNALAVIGFLIGVDDAKASGILESVVKALEATAPYDDKAVSATVDNSAILLRDQINKQSKIYHYEGSLTTPDCYEIVQWIVLSDPIFAKSADVATIREKTKQTSTFRKIQELKDRKLTALPISF